jgi:hypothetical protein
MTQEAKKKLCDQLLRIWQKEFTRGDKVTAKIIAEAHHVILKEVTNEQRNPV